MQIFISIASYQDPLLKNTIEDAFDKALYKSPWFLEFVISPAWVFGQDPVNFFGVIFGSSHTQLKRCSLGSFGCSRC